MAEMQNQDPTQPMDPTAMVSQLATISQVGQAVQTNTTLASLLTTSALTQAELAVGGQVTSSDGKSSGEVQSVNVSSAGAATATLIDTHGIILPGLIVATLFALVGPLINLLDSSVPDAFKRSLQMVWPHFMLVFALITLPLAVEHEVVVFVAELVPHEHIWAVFLTTFVLGDLFGMALGLAFQVIDDILDVTQSSETLGKSAGKDVAAEKATYPAVVGLEESRKVAKRLTEEAHRSLQPFGQKSEVLHGIADYLLDREY